MCAVKLISAHMTPRCIHCLLLSACSWWLAHPYPARVLASAPDLHPSRLSCGVFAEAKKLCVCLLCVCEVQPASMLLCFKLMDDAGTGLGQNHCSHGLAPPLGQPMEWCGAGCQRLACTGAHTSWQIVPGKKSTVAC